VRWTSRQFAACFEIESGELFGLLGPNGAGKTTTIKMLITLLIPTSGTARVLGYDVVADARDGT
jgi:ABC-2 type transport system ATP-binding protein